MAKKLHMTLSQKHMELLLEHVEVYIVNEAIAQEIKSSTLKDGFYSISLDADELDELTGSIMFVSNDDETDALIVEELDALADHFESYLELG